MAGAYITFDMGCCKEGVDFISGLKYGCIQIEDGFLLGSPSVFMSFEEVKDAGGEINYIRKEKR